MTTFRKMKDPYVPKRWTLMKILHTISGIGEKLKKEPKYTKQWYIMQSRREIQQIKKHIIFFEQIIERFEKHDESTPLTKQP